MGAAGESSEKGSRASDVPAWLYVVGVLTRIVFIITLVVVILLVSRPQSETIWTAYETPADLIRMISGYVICVGLMIYLFTTPKDAASHRVLLYVGAAVVPFALICLLANW